MGSAEYSDGVVPPGGADWACLRNDGVMEIDVRLMIRTHDETHDARRRWVNRHQFIDIGQLVRTKRSRECDICATE